MFGNRILRFERPDHLLKAVPGNGLQQRAHSTVGIHTGNVRQRYFRFQRRAVAPPAKQEVQLIVDLGTRGSHQIGAHEQRRGNALLQQSGHRDIVEIPVAVVKCNGRDAGVDVIDARPDSSKAPSFIETRQTGIAGRASPDAAPAWRRSRAGKELRFGARRKVLHHPVVPDDQRSAAGAGQRAHDALSSPGTRITEACRSRFDPGSNHQG